MLAIATKEGLSLNTAAMTALVAGANGDLRLVLGQLQMLRLRAVALSYDDVKNKMAANKVRARTAGAMQHPVSWPSRLIRYCLRCSTRSRCVSGPTRKPSYCHTVVTALQAPSSFCKYAATP